MEVEQGRLGGHPADSVRCPYCGEGVAIAVWEDNDWQGFIVRTAHFKTDTLAVVHRLNLGATADVWVDGTIGRPYEERISQAAYISATHHRFLNAFRELHLTCQGDTRDVDET